MTTKKPVRKPPKQIKVVEPVPEPVVEPIQEIATTLDDMLEAETRYVDEALIRVRAKAYYSNGDFAVGWQAGEVRMISLALLDRLEQDLPDNWQVVYG